MLAGHPLHHLRLLAPTAGCLPSLATIPIFIGLFRSLSDFSSKEEAGNAGGRALGEGGAVLRRGGAWCCRQQAHCGDGCILLSPQSNPNAEQ